MTQEVLKLALEALERSVATCFDQYAHQQVMSQPDHFINQAITSLQQAIAELESQEPVSHQKWCASLTQLLLSMPPQPAPCNCHPSQRTEQEQPLPPVEIGVDVTADGASVVAFYRRPNAVMEMFYSQFHPVPQRTRVVFPTMLRKMWSGGEVQAWLDENVNKENKHD